MFGTGARRHNLGYWTHEVAARVPDQPAIIDWEDGRQRLLTYGQLEAQLDTAASALASATGFGQRIAIGIGNRAEFVVALFGAMRAGLVPIPLNLRQGPGHIAHALKDSGSVAAIVDSAANRWLPDLVDEAGIKLRIALGDVPPGWIDYASFFAKPSHAFEPPVLPRDHPAMQPYTSGSTGTPKGVVLSHAGQIWWIRTYLDLYKPSPEERSLVAVPLYHKNAMAGVVKAKMPGGTTMVLMPRYDAREFLSNLAKFRCTHATGVPTIYSLALRETDLVETLDFSSLRSLTIGSAPVHQELSRAMEDAFRCRVFESYGLTEGGPVMFGPPPDLRPIPPGSCGTLWPDCEAKLVTADGADRVAEAGELWVRNPGVMLGYHNLPAVTASRLQDGWLRTGDLFTADADGFWFFRGRTDDMFVCGGENIFPKEVEELLLTHPAIREACVVPVVHATKGHAPVALVVAASDLDEEGLKAFCIERGPIYAHPRRVIFTAALPLNGAGKVDRAQVAKQFRNILIEAEPLISGSPGNLVVDNKSVS